MKNIFASVLFILFVFLLYFYEFLPGMNGTKNSGDKIERKEQLNYAPVIVSVTADPKKILIGETTEIRSVAFDSAGGPLVYSWSCDSGTINTPASPEMSWTAPMSSGTYTIKLSVINLKSKVSVGSVNVEVLSGPY